MIQNSNELPVAVIGAGPVGLAAAAHLVGRGLTPIVFEKGPGAGHAIRSWRHVRVFSPWTYNIDSAARKLLEETGWQPPPGDGLPTGDDIVREYLEPLASHPAIAPRVVYGAEVTSIGRKGMDRVTTSHRTESPFVIRWKDPKGREQKIDARAVIDASGTWFSPNPMGTDGYPVQGEREFTGRIFYGIPDVLGNFKDLYANRRVLVVGAGHSAVNVVLDLVRLRETAPRTQVIWSLRKDRTEKQFGGGLNDKLPARGALGLAARKAIEEKHLQLLAPFAPQSIQSTDSGLHVTGIHQGLDIEFDVDRVIVATGFRPDLGILREVRVSLDPVLEAPPALAPLIDPNLHSCGTVPPHGAAELQHPSEPGFYIVGSKSYGRAPTFLMATGYEQVRSVVAEIAGDQKASHEVRLALPETGVCSAPLPSSGCCGADEPARERPMIAIRPPSRSSCCGGPSPEDDGACCLKDHAAKADGLDGCGCHSTPQSIAPPS